jgi:monoamine oxidase
LASIFSNYKDCKLLLNESVIRVIQRKNNSQNESEHNVEVTTSNGKTFRGKYVVMAIPPTQISKVEFRPQFPFQREQVTPLSISRSLFFY